MNKMMINNKLISRELITKLNLNRFPEQLFKTGEEQKILAFLKKYPAKYYAIRDASKPSGTFKLKVLASDVINEVQNYSLFTINVSSANYFDKQIITGEIQILSNNLVYATLSIDKMASARDAVNKPDFNINTSIFDNKTLNAIPGFDIIYDYIIKYNLKDVIVEFALFEEKVGINQENVIIYEIRTHY